MMKSPLQGALCACLLTMVVSINANAATLVLLDDFQIVKNGGVIFQDIFSNGTPPPDTGGNTQTYTVRGGPLGPESGGKLTLDADSGEIVTRPDAGTMARQGARVNTSRSSTDTTKGLRTDDTFSIIGLFDITLVPGVRERYGVRLTDGGSSQRDDNLGLSVMRTSVSQIDIAFSRFDQIADTWTILDSIALDIVGSHDQIELSLSRLDTMNNDITASFAYVDGGTKGATTTFGTTAAIFNGEDFTRGQFMYLAPVPVPPAVWLFGSGLLGLVGMARRKKTA